MEFKDWLIKSEDSGAIKIGRRYEDPEFQANVEAKYGRYGAYPTYSQEYMKKKQKKKQKKD